jgi:serine/threonine protein phosphatase 1
MREIAFGDIHGCVNTLRDLLNEVKPISTDTLIFLGDYIDRGYFSAEVIDELLNLKEKVPNTMFLKGNHEDMFLKAAKGRREDIYLFTYNGGGATLHSYEDLYNVSTFDEIPLAHKDFFKKLLPFYKSKAYYVHAGFQPGTKPENGAESDLLWIRDHFLGTEYDFGKLVVHGHTPSKTPDIQKYRIGIDTGCVYGGSLTAYIVNEDRFISVKKSDNDRRIK